MISKTCKRWRDHARAVPYLYKFTFRSRRKASESSFISTISVDAGAPERRFSDED